MKYIRTKDKIREIIEDFGGSCNVKSTYPKGRPAIDNFTVVSGIRFAPRADTIEDLCDEFVIVDKYGNKPRMVITDGFAVKMGHTVYGAIWTDKGLIYVAKMNEKGELELL